MPTKNELSPKDVTILSALLPGVPFNFCRLYSMLSEDGHAFLLRLRPNYVNIIDLSPPLPGVSRDEDQSRDCANSN